jgi:putative membrane protein
MKSKNMGILAVLIGLVLLLVLPSLFMIGQFFGVGYGGMMGGGYGGMHTFGGGMMLFAWLIPAGLLVLLVVGGAALFNSLIRPGNSNLPGGDRKCSGCGKPAQADWTTCPYCGKSL